MRPKHVIYWPNFMSTAEQQLY